MVRQLHEQGATRYWNPSSILPETHPIGLDLKKRYIRNRYAVIVLNQPLEAPQTYLEVVRESLCTVAADGGGNRLYDLDAQDSLEGKAKPEAICGDLDSLLPHVRSYWEGKGVQIVQDSDQYSTDLYKCLVYLRSKLPAVKDEQGTPHPRDTVIFGGLGGRADQAFSLLHYLYVAGQDPDLTAGDLYLFTPESVIFLLQPGRNIIHIPQDDHVLFTENVGIIPVGKPSIISTKGLEWDVQDWHTHFGKQISTSNHVKTPEVEVVTTERVLFTLELGKKWRPPASTAASKER
jgi:thiamine pyrophosphokinase